MNIKNILSKIFRKKEKVEFEFKVNDIVISRINFNDKNENKIFTEGVDYKIEKIEDNKIFIFDDYFDIVCFSKSNFYSLFRKPNWLENFLL